MYGIGKACGVVLALPREEGTRQMEIMLVEEGSNLEGMDMTINR
jgi:hypothetical protein